MPNLSALILAAGRGVRMKSNLPKVLHPVGGKALVDYVYGTLRGLKIHNVAVVVGYGSDRVKSHISKQSPKPKFILQKSLNGSGGAVRYGLGWLKKIRGDVLVICGDTPLLSQNQLKELVRKHRRARNKATVLTTQIPNPKGYGRILRSTDGSVEGIVEEWDASPEQRKISEINTGTYCFSAKELVQTLPRLTKKNAKKEYYLTDVLSFLNQQGHRVGAVVCRDYREALGINSRSDLALAQKALYLRKAMALMDQGVSIIDPDTVYIEESVRIGADTVIYPQTFIQGQSRIGKGCQIGPWSYIKDTHIENEATVMASFVDRGAIQKGAKVGPYSRVRPGGKIGPGAVLGNFSEVKNSVLGKGSKANHLTYLGDAKIGKNVNIGAGTITCNYDGFRKFPTVIQDQVFVGSNVNLVAPIKLGAHSVVGAGSTLSENVPAWALAVERGSAKLKKNWARRRLKKSKKK